MPDYLIASQIVLWLVVLVLTVVCVALARQIGVLYERVAPAGALSINKRLKVGETAPELALETLSGRRLTLGGTREDGRSTLIFFLSPLCPVCKTLLPVLRSIERAEAGWLDVLYASDGEVQEHARFVARASLPRDRYVLSESLGRGLGIAQLPYAVLIGADGAIAALGLVNTREQIESLFEAQARGVTSLQDYLRDATRPSGTGPNRRAAAKIKDGAAHGTV